MKDQLSALSTIINNYYKTRNPSGEWLNRNIKDVSSILFYLTTQRVDAHKKYNAVMFNRGAAKVNAQIIIADNEVPELYQLRHMIKAGYSCLDAMRSNLTSIRKERQYTNTQP